MTLPIERLLQLSAITPRWRSVETPDSLAPAIGFAARNNWQSGQVPAVEAYYIRPSEAESKLGK